jgi:hypothetical protein
LAYLVGVPYSVSSLIVNGTMTEINFHGDDAALLVVNVALRGGSTTHFRENEP